MHIMRVCLFLRILLMMVPKQGPMNGSQYLTTTISGFSRDRRVPTLIQLIGLIEFIRTRMLRSFGGGSVDI